MLRPSARFRGWTRLMVMARSNFRVIAKFRILVRARLGLGLVLELVLGFG